MTRLTKYRVVSDQKAYKAVYFNRPIENETMLRTHERGLKTLPPTNARAFSGPSENKRFYPETLAIQDPKHEFIADRQDWYAWLQATFIRNWNGQFRIHRRSLAGVSLLWMRFICKFCVASMSISTKHES